MHFLLYHIPTVLFYCKYLMAGEQDAYSRLMSEAQNGSSKSYHLLLGHVSEMLSKFLARRIFSVDDREDVLQEILIAIHRSRHTYLPTKPFSPWMYAIAKNFLIKYYKSLNKEYSRLVISEIDQIVSPVPSENEERKKFSEMIQLVRELPDKQREVIVMLKIQGLSIKEVSTKLGLSESNVRVIAHRGYQTIRDRVKK